MYPVYTCTCIYKIDFVLDMQVLYKSLIPHKIHFRRGVRCCAPP